MALLLWLSALACTPKLGDLDTAALGPSDADGDGYTADVDCDDQDPSIHPDADEVCDGVDQDCDQELDEGVLRQFFEDADGDTFGAEEAWACEAPPQHVEIDGDCDDNNAAVHPDAEEVCNRIDDNCDGTIDESVKTTFYLDRDEDGYGDPDEPFAACEAPNGYVADTDDCNDADPKVNPGALDVCDDWDNDCDGEMNEDPDRVFYEDADGDGDGNPDALVYACEEPANASVNSLDCDDTDPMAHSHTIWLLDDDGDGFGDDAKVIESCEMPSGATPTHLGKDCDDSSTATYPGADEVCDSDDNDCDGLYDESAIDAETWYEDTDKDGYGGAGSSTVACLQPTVNHYNDGGADCDDSNAAVFPGATEYCDSVDWDCDSTVDESGASDAATWYYDGDSDGYGVTTTTTVSCTEPSGYAALDGDCDDADASYSPGAEDVCDDGLDQDCSGVADDFCPEDHCGTISADETWAPGPHTLSCDVVIEATVTVSDGAIIEVDDGVAITVGDAATGTLDVQGTSIGVVMTTASTSAASGNWEGLVFGPYDGGSELTGLTLSYAGGNGYGGVWVDGASPLFEGCVLSYNAGAGIHVSDGSPSIDGCTLQYNDDQGLVVEGGTLSSATAGYGFANSSVLYNGGDAIQVTPDLPVEIDPSTVVSGNGDDVVALSSGTLTSDTTWPALGVNYVVLGDVSVDDASAPLLTIDPGVVVGFESGAGLLIGASAGGALDMTGTSPATAVVLTSAQLSPGTGDWDGVTFGAYTDTSATSLSYIDVRYGGANGYGNLYFVSGTYSISMGTYAYSASYGMYFSSGVSVSHTGSSFTGNLSGDHN